MDGMTDATNQSPAASTAPTRGVRYAGDASLIEVMFDQLEYLTAHSISKCGPGCLECARFAQVKDWLLAPFRPAR